MNLLDHRSISRHESGEGALDDVAEVRGYFVVQNQEEPLESPEGHGWGPICTPFPVSTILKQVIFGRDKMEFELIFEV